MGKYQLTKKQIYIRSYKKENKMGKQLFDKYINEILNNNYSNVNEFFAILQKYLENMIIYKFSHIYKQNNSFVDDAKDIVSNVLFKVFKDNYKIIRNLENPQNFNVYVVRVLRNEIYTYLKEKNNRFINLENVYKQSNDEEEDSVEAFIDFVYNKDKQVDLFNFVNTDIFIELVINRLKKVEPEIDAVLFIQRKIFKIRSEELKKCYNLSIENINTKVSRVLSMLKKEFEFLKDKFEITSINPSNFREKLIEILIEFENSEKNKKNKKE